ncbi:MAG: Peptidase rane alanine aminopeptidase [Flavipsychrobacter sp.]|nr:Peptidase rane alanine aminopeptidase [Flavipsychrobacter sp.]
MNNKLFKALLVMWYLLRANTTFAYTHIADTLRGSNGRHRAWSDMEKYDLSVEFDTATKSIKGCVIMELSVFSTPTDTFQLDLQEPMEIDSVFQHYGGPGLAIRQRVDFKREGNVYWLTLPNAPFHTWRRTERRGFRVYYHGTPRKAVNPPWDGGFSWAHDSTGKQWIAVSCQGLGASAWWPCKDAQWDEPDFGVDMHLTVPGNCQAIGNGRSTGTTTKNDMTTYSWQVTNPINLYDVSFYIGDYAHWQDTVMGEKGKLTLDFYALKYNEERARKQFAVVKQMIHCFEYWLGPYPFYEDGYKLVEAPYLGMEHQSAVAYGNKYQMGYKGTDRTNTGIGLKFDYIIVHESAHEWFGNSITAKDMADNWVHEGITTYSESLFAECLLGKEKGQAYCRGEWLNIRNDKPMIGPYGVNTEGSGDIYDKGVAIMHMIRTMTNDDQKFRQMLRGLSKTFYHKTVTTKEIENYIAKQTGLDLTAFFNQYLRTADVPQLEYYIKKKVLHYKFNDIVPGFTLPLTVGKENNSIVIKPTAEWQEVKWSGGYNVRFSKDYLIRVK